MFVASALSTAGVSTVGGTALVATVNHLQLGWATSAMSRVAGWLA